MQTRAEKFKFLADVISSKEPIVYTVPNYGIGPSYGPIKIAQVISIEGNAREIGLSVKCVIGESLHVSGVDVDYDTGDIVYLNFLGCEFHKIGEI